VIDLSGLQSVSFGAMSLSIEEGLRLVRAYGAAERWLAVLVTTGRDAPSVSVVNAGVLPHPSTGEPVVAFVARGATAKLANLRTDPRATLVFRSGWEWVAVRGPVELAGPDDPLAGVDLRGLLRDIFTAAGGEHADLDEYDRVMAAERRTAVLLKPERLTSNPPGTEHEEHS
jgi:PPOX class probable F420-dependent enzyme